MPRRIRLNNEVRPDGRLDQQDLGQVRAALWRLGLFDPARDPSGSESTMSDGLRRALRTIQASQGLREDATLKPDGQTVGLINHLLEQNLSLRADDGLAARERTPGALAGPVGPNQPNHPKDVAATGDVLQHLGHIPPGAATPFKTGTLFDGIKRFQRQNGLAHDAVVKLGGETEQLLVQNLAGRTGEPQRLDGALTRGVIPSANIMTAEVRGEPGSTDPAPRRSFRSAAGARSEIPAGQDGNDLSVNQALHDNEIGDVFDEDFTTEDLPFESDQADNFTNFRVGRGMLTEFRWRPDPDRPGSFVKIDPGTGNVMRGRNGQPVTANEFELAPTDLPDELIEELDLLKKQWGINPAMPGADNTNILRILQDMSRVRTMSREELDGLVARTFQLERLDRDNISLAQTLRLRINSAQAEPFRWVRVLTDQELSDQLKISAEVAGLSKEVDELFGDVRHAWTVAAVPRKKIKPFMRRLGVLVSSISFAAEKTNIHFSDRVTKYGAELQRRLEASKAGKKN